MGSRLFWRRSATAVGIYSATILGMLGTILAARALSRSEFGLLTIVVSATAFLQSFLDVTVEEVVIKYGFRYSTAGDWGRFRRLFSRALVFKGLGGVLGAVALLGLAPLAHAIWGKGLLVPFLITACLPLAQAPEGIAGTAIILRGRYDIRSYFLTFSMAMRCLALGIGAQFGVTEALVGIVLGQVVASAAIGFAGWLAFRRFPQADAVRLGDDRRTILSFVGQSTLATTVLSLRGTLGPLLVGGVSNRVQAGYFRIAQSPQGALQSLSAPARLILLTEQTRDWEHGRQSSVFDGVRRYTLAVAALTVIALPPALVFMPELLRFVVTGKYEAATNAARVLLAAGALAVVIGWTKSLPVSIGRPGLRVLTHGIETAVFIPVVTAFAVLWGATGAAAGVLISTCAFAVVWGFLLVRLRRDIHDAPAVGIEQALVP